MTKNFAERADGIKKKSILKYLKKAKNDKDLS